MRMREEVRRAIEAGEWIFLLGFEPNKSLCSGDLRKTIKTLSVEGVCFLATHLKIPWTEELTPRQILLQILRSNWISMFENGMNHLYTGMPKKEFKTIVGIEDRPKMLAYFKLDDFGGDVQKQIEAITERMVFIRESYLKKKYILTPA